MATKLQRGWAIVGRSHGLYIGWAMTRCMAIAQHVHDRHQRGEPAPSRYAFGSLNEQQLKVWQRCRRRGDRAVKVTITWSEA